MKVKKWLTVVFLLIGTIAFAQTEGDFNVTLTSDNAGVVITKYNGSASAVRIPAAIQGMPVREIGSEAFSDNDTITGVVIPEGVTVIQGAAFKSCHKLSSVTLPDTLTIIEDSTEVGSYSEWYGAFSNCTSLRLVVIPEGVTNIGRAAFSNCTSLISIILPNSLTRLGEGAFYRCEILDSIVLPPGLTVIEGGTFYGCKKLTSIVIPEGVTEIRGGYFRGAFEDCFGLTSITLPSSIEKIRGDAFKGCSALTAVIIPDAVTEIEFDSMWVQTFSGCNRLNLASQAALRRRGYTGNF